MDIDHSSTESIAKALKGTQISSSEKIRLATKTWREPYMVLPGKQTFLLEWLCTSLVKAATPGKNNKDAKDASDAILDLEYWELFRDILEGITYSRKRHRKYGLINPRQNGVTSGAEEQSPDILLRLPTIPIFTSLIQKVAPTSSSTFSSAPAKAGRKSKAPPTPVTAASSTDPSETPSEKVLEAATVCFDLLSGSLMSAWFQPTLEQYTPLVQTTLETLAEMVKDSAKVVSEKQHLALSFAQIILDRFKRLVAIQPNQKKVFSLIAGKMFDVLVQARVSIRMIQGETEKDCQESIGAILRTGLFHQEHLQEYTAGYVAGDEKSIQSYQKQLFDQIGAMLKQEHAAAALDALPILLGYFVQESRRKQRTLASSGFERGMESARETEFAFFKIVYVLAKNELPPLGNQPSEDSLAKFAIIMEALNRLLATLLDLNMYQPSNNEAADQYVFMSSSFEAIHTCLSTAEKISSGQLQSTSLAGIMLLAQLDDRLLKPHLDSLWPVLLCPSPEAKESSLKLLSTLLEIYGKASDLKVFLTSLMSALRGYVTQPELLKESPIMSRAFLDLIPSNIKTYLPLPQAPSILDVFVTELMTLDSSMDMDGLELAPEPSHQKKRKLNSGKPKDQVSSIRSAELVTALFTQFLKGLRITANQEKQINKEFHVLFEHFLKQVFEKLRGSKKDIDNTEDFQSRRLVPALKLHYALCKASTIYWTDALSEDFLGDMVATFKSTSGWIDASVLTLNRVVLQHVHLILCSRTMDEGFLKLCNNFVQFTMKSSLLKRLLDDASLCIAPWDGRLETATGSSFLVASWQIQVNDWLDIVCRFGTTQHMELIAEVIAGQFSVSVDTNSENSITIHSLNQVLLRSANFYEVPNFRPIFAQKIIHALSTSVTALSETDLEVQLAATISTFTIEATKDSMVQKKPYTEALKELVEVLQQESSKSKSKSKSKKGLSKAAEEHGPHLLSLLSIMHLLPLEYFERNERNIILTVMAVLDYYIQRHLPAESIGVKCLLLVRRISNAIMTWRNDTGVLFYHPAILLKLLNHASWNVATSYGAEDREGLGHAIMNTTCSMVESTIRFAMSKAHDVTQHEAAYQTLDALLNTLMVWAGESLEKSNTFSDRRISEARIKVVMISRACQSFVQCLELFYHQKSKTYKKSTTEMITKHDELLKRIGKLFDVVQAKTNQRIKKVLALTGKETGALLEEAQKAMDHFVIYKTVVLFRRLQSEHGQVDRSGSLDQVPELFALAKVLVQTAMLGENSGTSGLAHLAAVLTGYACEYLPVSDAWLSHSSSEEGSLEGLQLLLMLISGQDLEEQDVTMLKEAYLAMLGHLTGEDFEHLIHWLLEDGGRSTEGDGTVDELVLVRFLNVTFLGVHQSQKRKVRRHTSKLLTRLTRTLQQSCSVNVVVSVLDVLAGICSDSAFDLRPWELGLVLEGVTSLMSPATPLLRGNGAATTEERSNLSNQDTTRIFTALYHVLMNSVRFHQEALVDLIPVFTAILQGIFHGFKSLHGSIAKKQQGVESLIKSPFMLLSAGAVHPEGNSGGDVVIGDPLPVECAENFARLLTALGSKGVGGFNSQGAGGHQEAGPAAATHSAVDGSKAFGKHAPYLLMEYFTIQSSVLASISQQSLRNGLLPGLYGLMNLCSDWEREMMMVGLDNTGKTLLKGLYADYLKYHKYTGR